VGCAQLDRTVVPAPDGVDEARGTGVRVAHRPSVDACADLIVRRS
jgi:hypothetical protein